MSEGGNACPVCGRVKTRLHMVSWMDEQGVEHKDPACYACKFNVYPPTSREFGRVQEWRLERHLSVRKADPAAASRATAARAARAAGEAAPDWGALRDKQMVKAEVEKKARGGWYTQQIFDRCGKEVVVPIVVDVPDWMATASKRRRIVTWSHPECWERFVERMRAAGKALFEKHPVYRVGDGGKRTLVAYVVPGRGRVPLSEMAVDAGFCSECDHLLEVCVCPGGPGLESPPAEEDYPDGGEGAREVPPPARPARPVRAKAAAPRRGRGPKECGCGCGEMTKGGRFRPGHDARVHAKGRAEIMERG